MDQLQRFFQLHMIAGRRRSGTCSRRHAHLRPAPGPVGGAAGEPRPAYLLKVPLEEILRFHLPMMQLRRTAGADAEMGGQRIATGDKVVVFYVSGKSTDTASCRSRSGPAAA